VLVVLVAFVVLAVLGLVIDVVTNYNRIHRGVTLQGVDIGGLTREDAAALLEEQLGAVSAAAPVDLFATEELEREGVGEATVDLTGASTSYSLDEEGKAGQSWRISPATVGATVDGAALAEGAFTVGRGDDFFFGRLKASFLGVELEGSLNYEPSQLEGLEALLRDALGWREENAGIRFEEGAFVVVESKEGYGADHSAFVAALDRGFLGTARSLVVPMAVIPVLVTNEEAAAVAAYAQKAIEQPVALIYEDEEPWSLVAEDLGPWIATSIVGEAEQAQLVPHVAADWLKEGIYGVIGERDPGTTPQDARFEVVDGQVSIVESVNGTGIDYARVAADLDAVLFPATDAAPQRQVTLSIATLEPGFSTAQATEMRITDEIASYTTEFTTASSAKVANIKLAADLINNSLIEPGGTWSFNDTTGECNAELGFQQAKSIVEGEYVDEIGGGICQVATTIFNAVFDSGLPIAERVNHALYLIAYPAGRDAAVSWRWPDLKFENDTGNWMLLTMSHTDNSVTATLWGTDPGYKVQTEDTGFTDRTDFETKEIENPEMPKGEKHVKQEGVRGRTIVVTRYVYNSAGELLRKTAFKSVYEPEKEIVEVGTKADPADEEEPKEGEAQPSP
jgi:vancomycin resistance protein YoaR